MFFLVDAFTEFAFKGNPAGVCLLNEYPSDSELQKIASYYNWSEIAFLKRMNDNTFQIRWFSPKDEAPLCGHATLASAHVLFSNNCVTGNVINFRYNTGRLLATQSENGITLTFPAKPVTKCNHIPFSIKKILGINSYKEILADDHIYVIVLNSKDDVINAIPNFDEIKKIDCRAIAITAYGDEKFDFYSRYFAPRVGIYEDPVCGSMHCRLACYWALVLNKNKFRAYQASARGGILDVELEGDMVKLTSRAITLCEISLPASFCGLLI